MKKIKQPLALSFFFTLIFSFSFGAPVSIPVNDPPSWNTVRVSEIVKLSAKDFQKITGKKMQLKEKIAFSISKAKMKRWLKKHEDVLLTDYLQKTANEEKKFSWPWFAIGLLSVGLGLLLSFNFIFSLAPLIVLPLATTVFVYVTKRNKVERNSFWVGLILGGIGFMILAIIAAASYGSFAF